MGTSTGRTDGLRATDWVGCAVNLFHRLHMSHIYPCQ